MAKKIGILVGETSGDQLGAPIINTLKEQHPDIELCGVGGSLLEKQGLKSYFDYSELSIIGLFEIIKRYNALNNRITETVERMEHDAPDVVLSIDAPEFAKRVIKKLRKRLPDTVFIHMVAPTVWAWRPKRAKQFARIFDHLLCLFPFEPTYFTAEGMKADFIGHPAVFDIPFNEDINVDKIGVLYGSRAQEILNLLPIFNNVIQLFKKETSSNNLSIKTLVNNRNKALINAPFDIQFETDKPKFLKETGIALAASGTMAFELALAGIPHVIAYKVHPLSHLMIKSMTKTPYAHLANIIGQERGVPEFLQYDATAKNLTASMVALHNDKEARDAQRTFFKRVRSMLQTDCNPSEKAAEIISAYL